MKLKTISALVSISTIIVGGILQELSFSSGKAIVILGVGILIFVFIPIFLVEVCFIMLKIDIRYYFSNPGKSFKIKPGQEKSAKSGFMF